MEDLNEDALSKLKETILKVAQDSRFEPVYSSWREREAAKAVSEACNSCRWRPDKVFFKITEIERSEWKFREIIGNYCSLQFTRDKEGRSSEDDYPKYIGMSLEDVFEALRNNFEGREHVKVCRTSAQFMTPRAEITGTVKEFLEFNNELGMVT